MTRPECAFPGCHSPVKSRGHCDAHYHQLLRGTPLHPVRAARAPICTMPECGRPHFAKGLCSGHYEQTRQGHEPRPLRVRHTGCDYPGCVRPHRAKGLCSAHWRQQHDGKPLTPLDAPKQRAARAASKPKLRPRPQKETPMKLPKGWDRPSPRPTTPVAAVGRFMREIPPGSDISPEMSQLALRGLHRWGVDELADMLGIRRTEAA